MSRILNGVDVDRLNETIETVKADAGTAVFEFRVDNRWVDAGQNISLIDGYYGAHQEFERETPFELVNDEPPVLLSGDRGPNPVENLLHALAGCLTTSLVYHAAARGMAVEGVRTRFVGNLDLRGFLGLEKKIRPGFNAIRVLFEIDGDMDEETKRELIGIARRHSPVADMVSNGVAVETRLAEANGERAAA